MNQNKSILLEFKHVSNLVKRYISSDSDIKQYEGLTGVRMALIGFIGENSLKKDVFQKDIENEFVIRRSTATNLLKQLEKDGYIERHSVAQDARLKKLVLTPLAKEICSNVMDSFSVVSDEMMRGMTAEETEMLFYLIDKIKSNLKEVKDI